MPLDSVHFEAIEGVIGSIDRPGRASRLAELAERLWERAVVDPPPEVPIAPVGAPERHQAPVNELAVGERPFDRVSAVDAGSLNPTTFQNGLVVDLAHAAMATTPSDLDRHRERTIVAVVHGPPAEIRTDRGWSTFDGGHGRAKLVAAPTIDREEETAVHTLALEGAEVEHALDNRDGFGDLLVIDGSVYPASVLHWEDREGALRTRIGDRVPRRILEGAIEVVDGCAADDVPVVGFVKNWTARGLVRRIERDGAIDVDHLPWRTDYGLFQQWLDDIEVDEEPALRWTSWLEMDYGVGTALARAIDDHGLAASGPPDRYRLAFMVVYEPRENVAFRVEAPRELIADDDRRRRITEHVLGGIAETAGPPPTLAKADALAGIGRLERRQLRRQLAGILDTRELQGYDAVRWSEVPPGEAPMGNR